jgi:hypothetical protein
MLCKCEDDDEDKAAACAAAEDGDTVDGEPAAESSFSSDCATGDGDDDVAVGAAEVAEVEEVEPPPGK